MKQSDLPIRKYAQDILGALKESDTVVVVGETGSGKTTQLSQILYENGFAEKGTVGITQPRRVAAISVAQRVAEELDADLGGLVGYTIRFDDRSSSHTRIKYVTDGTLLREVLSEPLLSHYSVVILDEAHERTLATDLLLGVLKHLLHVRNRPPAPPPVAGSSTAKPPHEAGGNPGPLKLLVTSATLEEAKIVEYFGGCPIVRVPGRLFPVSVVYSKQLYPTSYVQAAVETVLHVHCTQPEGSVLLFLTGMAEIQRAVAKIEEGVRGLPKGSAGPLQVLPLYAALPAVQQARIFAPLPKGWRRCIVATNIAETSVTVPGVVYVIDSGYTKQLQHQASSGMDLLRVTSASQVQAEQRRGRAGRMSAGKCYRLYTCGGRNTCRDTWAGKDAMR